MEKHVCPGGTCVRAKHVCPGRPGGRNTCVQGKKSELGTLLVGGLVLYIFIYLRA